MQKIGLKSLQEYSADDAVFLGALRIKEILEFVCYGLTVNNQSQKEQKSLQSIEE